MKTITNPENFRENIRKKLKERVLSFYDSQSDIFSKNMEKGIYNYTIKESNRRKIIKKWANPLFVQLYIDMLYINYLFALPIALPIGLPIGSYWLLLGSAAEAKPVNLDQQRTGKHIQYAIQQAIQ